MRRLYIFLILAVVFYVLAVQAAMVLAAESRFIEDLRTTAGGAGAGYPDPEAGGSTPMNFLAVILGQALTPMFMGVSVMIALAYGGYKWMMARGNEQQVELAKTIITNTIIAALVAFSAYAIVGLIIPLWEFVSK